MVRSTRPHPRDWNSTRVPASWKRSRERRACVTWGHAKEYCAVRPLPRQDGSPSSLGYRSLLKGGGVGLQSRRGAVGAAALPNAEEWKGVAGSPRRDANTAQTLDSVALSLVPHSLPLIANHYPCPWVCNILCNMIPRTRHLTCTGCTRGSTSNTGGIAAALQGGSQSSGAKDVGDGSEY
jgi:hypothetical protein